MFNVFIGYLLHRITTGFEGLVLFFITMALRSVTNDYGLREDHKDLYTRIGRWVLG